MPTTNNTFPGFDRSFKKMSAVEFKAVHGPELQRAAQLKAQGKDTTALEAELRRIEELQKQGKPIPKIDLDKFVKDARLATPTTGLPSTGTASTAGIPTTLRPASPTTSPLATRIAATTTPRE